MTLLKAQAAYVRSRRSPSLEVLLEGARAAQAVGGCPRESTHPAADSIVEVKAAASETVVSSAVPPYLA